MIGISLEVTYWQGQPLVAYYYLASTAPRLCARTMLVDDTMLVDFDAEGRVLGVELLEPLRLPRGALDRLLVSLGLPRTGPSDLLPLLMQ